MVDYNLDVIGNMVDYNLDVGGNMVLLQFGCQWEYGKILHVKFSFAMIFLYYWISLTTVL